MAASTLHLAAASPPPTASAAAPRSGAFIPTMSDISEAAGAQNLWLELRTAGPFFRVRGLSLDEAAAELGRAEGVVRPWAGGPVLHLDSMRMSSATLRMERSVFGLGLFVGAAAVRHGFNRGCRRAELLAINDTDIYHSKLVRFYTKMGFTTVQEVDGSSAGDLLHMLVWGGRGTRMDAGVEELLVKWGGRFRPPPRS